MGGRIVGLLFAQLRGRHSACGGRARSRALAAALLLHGYMFTASQPVQAQSAAQGPVTPAAAPGAAPSARPTASVWMQQEQSRFGDWLAKRPSDILIAPFQVRGYGLDPAERILIAARLADLLSSTTGLSVADPVLVGRAMGESLRTYDEAALLLLAGRVHATSIVIGTAGHDGQNALRIDIRVLRKDPAGGAWREAGRKTWDGLLLSDEHPPYQLLPSVVPQVTEMLGAKPGSTSRRGPAVSVAASRTLPSLRSSFAATGGGPVNVHVAQLLAVCYPRAPESGAERAWIRTLRLALLTPASADSRLPVARALMHLDRRPAALAALGAPRTDAENALREVLNGNLPAATSYAAKITDPVLRLIAQIELRDVRLAYDTATPQIEAGSLSTLVPPHSDWYPFLQVRAKHEASKWGTESVAQTLMRFEHFLGSDDELLRELQTQLPALAARNDPDLKLAQIALTRYAASVKAEDPTRTDSAALMRWLLLDLYQTQVVADLLGEVTATIDTRDLPDEGNTLLANLDPLLRGHADFEAMRARLAWREYARWRGQQRARWLAIALSRTRDAYELSGHMTRALENAERSVAYTPEVAAALNPMRADNFWNWPVVVTWLPPALTEDRRSMQRYADGVMAYATVEFSTIAWLMKRDLISDRRQALEKATADRFDGSPASVTYRASALLAARNLKAAEEVYQHYVSARPMAFGPYYDYLDLLVSQGRHRDAFQMFSTHPGFAERSGADRVTLSNYAGWGARFFWPLGEFDYAEPLLRRSAEYDTGSDTSLGSAALLALYRGDPNGAAKLHMQIARRYSDIDALDDYFKLIFALGRPEEAWRTYKEVLHDGNGGRVLATVARQSRLLGWTDRQVIDWLDAPENRALADGTFFYAPRAALSASIMDREPDDLAGIVRRFAAPSPYAVDAPTGKVVRRIDPSAAVRKQAVVCGPSRYGNGPVGGVSRVKTVDSGLVYFAKGYEALDQKRYAEAFAVFDEAARLLEFYDTDCEGVSYMLSYLAFAAAQVKKTTALKDYLQDVPYRDRNVNYNLALAILAAMDSRHSEAEGYLDAALNRWTSNRYQPLPPEYIYADILERLYQQTGASEYRDRLVRWARARQRVAPSDAWTYAKEYRYTQQTADRARALGMALYLDPLSRTLHDVRPAEAAAARESLNGHNPFLAWRQQTKPAVGAPGR